MTVPGLSNDAFVTADQHFGHANIGRLCGRPADHFARMEHLWRERISADDLVVHLGDVSFRYADGDEMLWFLASLPGRKFLVRGNHDRQRPDWYVRAGFTVVPELEWRDPAARGGLRVIFSHRPVMPERLALCRSLNVHGHIHNNGYPAYASADLKYANVSVEVTGYAPVRLRDVIAGRAGQQRADAPWSTFDGRR